MTRRAQREGLTSGWRRSLVTIFLFTNLSSLPSADALEADNRPRLFDWQHVVGAETSALVRIVDGTLTTWFPSVGLCYIETAAGSSHSVPARSLDAIPF